MRGHITAPPPPVSEMTYTVSNGTLNCTIPYLIINQEELSGGKRLRNHNLNKKVNY